MAEFDEKSALVLSSAHLPTLTENAPLIGESSYHDLDDLYRQREQQVIFQLAKHLLEHYFREDTGQGEPKVWYFPQLLKIVREWMDGGWLRLKDGCRPQLLLLAENRHAAAERIFNAIVHGTGADERLRLILDQYAPEGSSAKIDFETTRAVYRTNPAKCQVNYVAIDSGWEAKMAQSLEAMPEVIAYVKNDGMNLRIPYIYEGHEHDYIPDFLARIRRENGDALNLIIEVTGQRHDTKQAKADTIHKLWLPGVTALEKYGRWEFIEILDPWDAQNSIRRALKQIEMTENA